MSRPFLIKDIALQAGVSIATVDRLLNGRGGVRQHTTRRIEQAILELERQRQQIGLAGRKFILDIVIEAPARFSGAVRQALEAEAPALHPAVFRSRYHLAEVRQALETVALLDAIGHRGSNGVLLKAPDEPEVTKAVGRLVQRGIPVVTLVTDLPTSSRLAYVGIDNRAAGETAAYLVGEWLGPVPASVLVTLSSNRFRGEEEREIGFRRALRERYPHLTIVEVSEGNGLDCGTGELVRQSLSRAPDIAGVYSIGGGNGAVLRAFDDAGRSCRVFVGHDLDADNIALLRAHRINAILHHDLRQDMRAACLHIMRAHGAIPASTALMTSNIQVVTAFNLPG
jgi:LacI family transcriptional regulator